MGYGGHPATVGANEGDGINYVQFGLFDTAGTRYLGAYPPKPFDGVGWLDNQSFIFSTCVSDIGPIVRGVSPCDTFILCAGDTALIHVLFISPKKTDTTSAGIFPPFLPGETILSNTTGNTDTIAIELIGGPGNYGFHTINVYGYTTNTSPEDTTFSSFVLEVDSSATGSIVASKDTICVGDSVNLSALASVHQYLWSTGQTTDSIEVKPAVTTTYTLQLAKGKCDLILTKTIVVLSSVVPTITLAKDSLCQGDSTTITATGGGTYKWLIAGNPVNSAITVKPPVNTTYSVVVITPCSTDTLSVTLHILQFPVITTSGNKTICRGNTASISAGGGTSYVWSPGGSTNSGITVSPTNTTTYPVTFSNGKCSKDTTVTIIVDTPAVITITPPPKLCIGDSITLTATGGPSYKWSNGATTSSITVKPGTTTTYTVVVTKNGCVDSATTTVTVDVPTLLVCCDTTIIKGGSATINATSATNYFWTPNSNLSCDTCASTVATPTVTTTYIVLTKDAQGCTIERIVTVTVEIPCADFTVPNIFTPNNDGRNDDFVINILNPASYSITIYDRWGKEVYTSTDPTVYWNGKLLNTAYLVPDGVYYYIIKATCGNNDYVKKGFVQVVGGN